jgi:hypothetical protein
VLARAFRNAMEAFNKFATGPGAQFMKNYFAPVLTRIINRIILVGRAIRDAFTPGKNTDNFKAFILSILYEFMILGRRILKVVGVIFTALAGPIGNFLDNLVVGFLNAFMKIAKGIKELSLFLAAAIGGAALAAAALPGGQGIAVGLAAAAATIAGIGVATIGLEKLVGNSTEAIGDKFNSLGQRMATATGRGFEKASELVAKGMDKVDKKYKEFTGKGINVPLVTILKDPNAIAKQIDEAKKRAAPAADAAGEGLGSRIQKAIKNKLMDVKQKFVEMLFGEADAQYERVANKLNRIIEKQKEKALKAFDDQAAALDALAAAEERLT